jgi:hypothetical protein
MGRLLYLTHTHCSVPLEFNHLSLLLCHAPRAVHLTTIRALCRPRAKEAQRSTDASEVQANSEISRYGKISERERNSLAGRISTRIPLELGVLQVKL